MADQLNLSSRGPGPIWAYGVFGTQSEAAHFIGRRRDHMPAWRNIRPKRNYTWDSLLPPSYTEPVDFYVIGRHIGTRSIYGPYEIPANVHLNQNRDCNSFEWRLADPNEV